METTRLLTLMIYFSDMGINIIKTGLLIIVTQFLLSSGCNKNKSSCLSASVAYSFNVTAEWKPQSEIYNIGDTMFIESTFPKKLTDQINTSMVVDYSNSLGIGGNLGIYELDTVQHQVKGAVSSFELSPVIGSISEGNIVPMEVKNISYKESNNSYSFKLRLISKTKGIFVIYTSDLLSMGLRGENCTKAGFTMTVTNGEKHENLWQYALQQVPDEGQKKGMYCFRVQ